MQYIKYIGLGLFFIALLLGCKEVSVNNTKNIDVSHALKTSLVVVNKHDNQIEVNMVFENISDNPLRIFYIDAPLFYKTHNHFYFVDGQGKKYFDMEEVPPHGLIVTAKDFYLIAPHEQKHFSAKIMLPVKDVKKVHWRYDNTLTSWKGNIETLDGKTKALFGGKEIPYIWVGTIETSAKIGKSVD